MLEGTQRQLIHKNDDGLSACAKCGWHLLTICLLPRQAHPNEARSLSSVGGSEVGEQPELLIRFQHPHVCCGSGGSLSRSLQCLLRETQGLLNLRHDIRRGGGSELGTHTTVNNNNGNNTGIDEYKYQGLFCS